MKEGKDILHVCLSSGITGVINSAMIAKTNLEEKYPQRKVCIVDSLAASSGVRALMDKVADQRDAGLSLANWSSGYWHIDWRSITGSFRQI